MKLINVMAMATLCVTSQLTYAEKLAVQYSEQSIHVQSTNNAKKLFKNTQENVDTTPIWYYINNGFTDQAQQEYLKLKKTYPNWVAEPVLVNAMDNLSKPTQLNNQVASQASASPVAIQQVKAPEAIILNFVNLAKKGPNYWPSMPQTHYQLASTLAFKDNTLSNNTLMAWVSIYRGNYQTALAHIKVVEETSPNNTSANEAKSIAINALVTDAVKKQNKSQLFALLKQYPDQAINEKIDAHAWQAIDQLEYTVALDWFEFTENYDAQLIVLEKQGRQTEATRLACNNPTQATLVNYCVDALSVIQLDQYNQQHYQSSLVAAAKIQTYQPLNADQLALYAWSQYKLNNQPESISAFSTLMTHQPNNSDYAQVLLSLLGDDQEQLEQLAINSPAMTAALKKREMQVAWSRKQFDRFNNLEDQQKANQQLTLEGGLDWRKQSSEDEIANLQSANYYLGFQKFWNDYRYGARVNYHTLHSDSANIGDDFWQNTLATSIASNNATETGISGFIKRQTRRLNTFAEIEYTQVDSDLASSLSAKLSAVWYNSASLITAATLYRERVDDSFLSLMGLYGSEIERWGAVKETGIRALTSYIFIPKWSVTPELNIARLTGESVQDNTKLALNLGFTRDLTERYADKLDYLRVGPTISWMSYYKNLNYYTDGNGGYFSPESYINLGGRAELLTLEDTYWQIRSQLSLGYYWVTPGSIEQFPFTSTSSTLSQENDSGIGSQFLIEGQWLLSPHWEIAGLISSSYAADYNETNINLNVRWNFVKKTGLTSDGLISSSTYTENYAWH
ncbi:cellulose synthase subunit BcsC-related outer membrane protein [Psychromonas sp. KJ10-2]|uniref:cellulose synthase subunit BcsC-related outer membrane protein n=1 Tax=Psychromonas sp. KJ10-2 TaxID=3391822 RepID=UPI0039B41718